MNKRAVTYARVSYDDRDNDSRNLRSQLRMCREYCEKHSYLVVAELAEDDRGASGASFELPQLNKIRDMARHKDFDVLVVREIDRLSRNIVKQLIVEEELKRNGIRIEYVLGDYPDTPEGNLMKNIKASVAEYERLKINERMSRARDDKVQEGSVMTHGQEPYGYRLAQDGKRWVLVIDEDEARIVRLIFQWYIEGDGEHGPLGIIGITRWLTKLGIPTYADNRERESAAKGMPKKFARKIRGYGEWSRASVHHILTNHTYAGIWQYGKRGITVDGMRKRNPDKPLREVTVPAIISEETWQAAQARLVYNRKASKRNLKHQERYLLNKLVICGDCRSRMAACPNHTRGKQYFYYRCNGHNAYAKGCTNTVSYSAQSLDSQVWSWIKRLISDPDQMNIGFEEYRAKQDEENGPIRERIDLLDGLIIDNQAQLNRLLDLYISGEFEKELLFERKTRLEELISGIHQEKERLEEKIEAQSLRADQLATVQEFASKIASGIDKAEHDHASKRAIIEALNTEVVLIREDGKKVAYASCVLGEEVLSIASKSSGMAGAGRSDRWRTQATAWSPPTNAVTT